MEDVNLYVANNRQQAVQMLFKGRVDLLMGGDIVLKNRLAQMGLSIQKLEKVFTLPRRRTGLSVALSKTTSKKLVTKFIHAFDALSKEAEFNELFRR